MVQRNPWDVRNDFDEYLPRQRLELLLLFRSLGWANGRDRFPVFETSSIRSSRSSSSRSLVVLASPGLDFTSAGEIEIFLGWGGLQTRETNKIYRNPSWSKYSLQLNWNMWSFAIGLTSSTGIFRKSSPVKALNRWLTVVWFRVLPEVLRALRVDAPSDWPSSLSRIQLSRAVIDDFLWLIMWLWGKRLK